VAAIDGLVLDALVRGDHDPATLAAAAARFAEPGGRGSGRPSRADPPPAAPPKG
jgi:hypothetical protein